MSWSVLVEKAQAKTEETLNSTTAFRLRKEKPGKDLTVKIATIDELKQSKFRNWFEVRE